MSRDSGSVTAPLPPPSDRRHRPGGRNGSIVPPSPRVSVSGRSSPSPDRDKDKDKDRALHRLSNISFSSTGSNRTSVFGSKPTTPSPSHGGPAIPFSSLSRPASRNTTKSSSYVLSSSAIATGISTPTAAPTPFLPSVEPTPAPDHEVGDIPGMYPMDSFAKEARLSSLPQPNILTPGNSSSANMSTMGYPASDHYAHSSSANTSHHGGHESSRHLTSPRGSNHTSNYNHGGRHSGSTRAAVDGTTSSSTTTTSSPTFQPYHPPRSSSSSSSGPVEHAAIHFVDDLRRAQQLLPLYEAKALGLIPTTGVDNNTGRDTGITKSGSSTSRGPYTTRGRLMKSGNIIEIVDESRPQRFDPPTAPSLSNFLSSSSSSSSSSLTSLSTINNVHPLGSISARGMNINYSTPFVQTAVKSATGPSQLSTSNAVAAIANTAAISAQLATYRDAMRTAKRQISELESQVTVLQEEKARAAEQAAARSAAEMQLKLARQRISVLLLQQQMRGIGDVDWHDEVSLGAKPLYDLKRTPLIKRGEGGESGVNISNNYNGYEIKGNIGLLKRPTTTPSLLTSSKSSSSITSNDPQRWAVLPSSSSPSTGLTSSHSHSHSSSSSSSTASSSSSSSTSLSPFAPPSASSSFAMTADGGALGGSVFINPALVQSQPNPKTKNNKNNNGTHGTKQKKTTIDGNEECVNNDNNEEPGSTEADPVSSSSSSSSTATTLSSSSRCVSLMSDRVVKPSRQEIQGPSKAQLIQAKEESKSMMSAMEMIEEVLNEGTAIDSEEKDEGVWITYNPNNIHIKNKINNNNNNADGHPTHDIDVDEMLMNAEGYHHPHEYEAPGGIGYNYGPRARGPVYEAQRESILLEQRGKNRTAEEELVVAEEVIKGLKRENARIEKARREAIEMCERANAQRREAEEKIIESENQLTVVQNDLYKLQGEYDCAIKDAFLLRSSEAKLKKIEVDYATLEKTSEVLKTKVKELSTKSHEKGRENDRLEKEVKYYKEKVGTMTERIGNLEKECETLRKKNDELDKKCGPMDRITKENYDLQIEVEKLKILNNNQAESIEARRMEIEERNKEIIKLEIHLDQVKRELGSLLASQAKRHASIARAGKLLSYLTTSVGVEFGTSKSKDGAIAKKVESSAASCGLLKGDKVVSIQSTPIHTKHEALSLLTPLKPGSSVILTIQRKGVTRSMEIVFVVGAVGYTNEQVALLQRVANYNQKDFDDIEGLDLPSFSQSRQPNITTSSSEAPGTTTNSTTSTGTGQDTSHVTPDGSVKEHPPISNQNSSNNGNNNTPRTNLNPDNRRRSRTSGSINQTPNAKNHVSGVKHDMDGSAPELTLTSSSSASDFRLPSSLPPHVLQSHRTGTPISRHGGSTMNPSNQSAFSLEALQRPSVPRTPSARSNTSDLR